MYRQLLKLIEERDNHCHCGVVGGSIFYHLLAENGSVDLALDIITQTEFPSYGNWIARGATTLWETYRKDEEEIDSLNHHFWGFISAWFYRYIAGLRINPNKTNVNEIEICPLFPKKISDSRASYDTVNGKIETEWHRTDSGIEIEAFIPAGIFGKIILPKGYTFENGQVEYDLTGNGKVILRVVG